MVAILRLRLRLSQAAVVVGVLLGLSAFMLRRTSARPSLIAWVLVVLPGLQEPGLRAALEVKAARPALAATL